jgi:hypothetical protein
MLDRSLMVRRFVVLGAAVAATATAAPLASADPAPLFIPHTQQARPRPGEGLSGADRAWLSTRQTTPRLGEGLNGTDRSWLKSSPNGGEMAVPSDGFEWGDAALGAGTATATLLILVGGAVAIRRRFSSAQ